jgi:hypothetical protein
MTAASEYDRLAHREQPGRLYTEGNPETLDSRRVSSAGASSPVMRLAVAAAGLTAVAAVGAPSVVAGEKSAPVLAPRVQRWDYTGKPRHAGETILVIVRIPAGECLRVVNVVALAEKHSGSRPAFGGEFTVMMGDFAQASLDTGSRIAYEQGERDVVWGPRKSFPLAIWLRRGENPALFYYSVAMTGEWFACRSRA